MPRAYKAMLVIFALLIAMFFLWLANPAHAECSTLATVKASVSKVFPKAKLSEMGGTEMTAFMFGFNALPPSTAIVADYGLVLQDPDRPKVAVILFQYGCFSATIFVGKRDFENLMGTL